MRRLALRLVERRRTRDASDRLLPSHFFVRAPVPRRFPVSSASSRPRFPGGIACHHVRAIRFGGPHQGHLSTATGVVLPSWRVRSSLWHPCRVSHFGPFARAKLPPCELPRPHPRRARVNVACGMCDPRCLPSDKDLRPATPFRAPGSGLRSRTAWPPTRERSAPFHHAQALASLSRLDPRPRAPLPAGTRFSGSRCCLPTSAT
jgi:hypothetical protein